MGSLKVHVPAAHGATGTGAFVSVPPSTDLRIFGNGHVMKESNPFEQLCMHNRSRLQQRRVLLLCLIQLMLVEELQINVSKPSSGFIRKKNFPSHVSAIRLERVVVAVVLHIRG
jgi:hypothetical protein